MAGGIPTEQKQAYRARERMAALEREANNAAKASNCSDRVNITGSIHMLQ